MRADAARRRAALIEAARTTIAIHGHDVALDTIAEAAGVGIATLYRNFDSRGALLDEVASVTLGEITTAAQSPLGWLDLLTRLADLNLGALTAALSDHANQALQPVVAQAQARALQALSHRLEIAQQAGDVRSDLTALELIAAIAMATRPQPAAIVRSAPKINEQLWRIVVAGLSA